MNDLKVMRTLNAGMKCCKNPDYRPKQTVRERHIDASRGCVGSTFRCQECGSECYVPDESKKEEGKKI